MEPSAAPAKLSKSAKRKQQKRAKRLLELDLAKTTGATCPLNEAYLKSKARRQEKMAIKTFGKGLQNARKACAAEPERVIEAKKMASFGEMQAFISNNDNRLLSRELLGKAVIPSAQALRFKSMASNLKKGVLQGDTPSLDLNEAKDYLHYIYFK